MKGILKHDFYLFRASLLPVLILTSVFVVTSFFTSHVLLVGNVISYMLIVATALGQYTNDISTGWALFCDISPASRRDYVKSKYLLVVILLLVAIAFFTVLFPFNPHLVKHGFFKYVCENAVIVFLTVLVISVAMPVILKVRETTAKIIVGAVSGVYTSFCTLFSINLQFAEPHIMIIVLCILFSSLFLFISFKISCKIYEGKEL